MELPATPTPLTRDATAQAVRAAFVRVFGGLPDRNTAELLLAQLWMENANGQSIIQRNFGNLSSSGTSGDYWRPPWFDRAAVEARPESDPNRARYLNLNDRMHRGEAPKAFQAFPTFDAGADAWLRLLSSARMRPILEAASSGNPVSFARAIFETGYCPDPECRTAAPQYARLQQQIRNSAYFDDLAEKKKAEPEHLGLWFWFWGQALSRRTSRRVHVDEDRLWGEL